MFEIPHGYLIGTSYSLQSRISTNSPGWHFVDNSTYYATKTIGMPAEVFLYMHPNGRFLSENL